MSLSIPMRRLVSATRKLVNSRSFSGSGSPIPRAAAATAAAAAAPATPRTYSRRTTPVSKASRPVAPAPPVDLIEDDFPPPADLIDDYAPPAAAALASPPLTTLPDQNYQPLPTISSGIEGEVAVRGAEENDWSTSFKGLSEKPFDRDTAEALLKPLEKDDVEVKPDGLLYLPEIKYRRTLNAAFGPGGWGMAPRGETNIGPRIVSREWGLVCLGRLVGIARGEQEYFDPSGIATATEACKSNALMRCCKDLGIASELWDPRFIREFKQKHCVEVWVEQGAQKRKRKLWRKKDAPKFEYPYKETGLA